MTRKKRFLSIFENRLCLFRILAFFATVIFLSTATNICSFEIISSKTTFSNAKISEDQHYYKTEDQIDKQKCDMERDEQVLQFYKKNKKLQGKKRLPDIIGIGAEKCGTGWFQFALQHHPMIRVNLNEVRFFNNNEYNKGIKYYINKMPNVTKFELAMEKSPGYFNFGTKVTPSRIKYHLPKVRLWLVLCDPAERTFSDFVHENALGHIDFRGTFDEYVEQFVPEARSRLLQTNEDNLEIVTKKWHENRKDSHILTTGIYYHSLKRWLKHFTSEQIFITSGEELQRDSGEVIERFQDFLAIPRMLLKHDFVKNQETGLYCIIPTVVSDSLVKRDQKACYTATALGVAKGRTRSNSTMHRPNPQKIRTLKKFFHNYDKMLFSLLQKKLW